MLMSPRDAVPTSYTNEHKDLLETTESIALLYGVTQLMCHHLYLDQPALDHLLDRLMKL